MGEVVQLAREETRLRGPAKCLACKREWEAIAPVGICTGLECPGCGLFKGALQGMVSVPEGHELWTCNCGCDAFRVTGLNGTFAGMMCINCGAEQNF